MFPRFVPIHGRYTVKTLTRRQQTGPRVPPANIRRLEAQEVRIQQLALRAYATRGVPTREARKEMQTYAAGLIALHEETGNPLWLWRALPAWCALLPWEAMPEPPSEAIMGYLMRAAFELKELRPSDRNRAAQLVAEVILADSPH